MPYHPAALAHAIRTLPAPYLVARGLARMGLGGQWRRRLEFLHAREVRQLSKSPDILLNALETAGMSARELLRAMRGARVVELGCGPHIGMAAFSVAAGAKSYIGLDPSVDPDLLATEVVRRRYLGPALRTNAAIVETIRGKGSAVPVAPEDLWQFVSARRGSVESQLRSTDKVDLFVSISCLEHVADVPAAAASMAAASNAGVKHLHLVNFSNHLSKNSPFIPLYEAPFAKFAARWGPLINGLRPSTLAGAMAEAGVPLRVVALERRPDALPDRVDGSWTDAHDLDSLSIRTALLTNLVPS